MGPLVEESKSGTGGRQLMTDWMLRCESGPLAGKLFPLPERSVIGRALNCEISIPEGGLSREHAEMIVESNQLVVRDLGSSNGTFINGERVTEGRPAHGDTLTFDNMSFRVIGPSNDMDRTIISMGPVARPAGVAPQPTPVMPAAAVTPGAAMPRPATTVRAPARASAGQAKGLPAWIALMAVVLVVVVVVLLVI